MAIQADAYVVAGDLVNWGRGLDKIVEPMLPKATNTYILPGNHESAADIASFCSRYGFHEFHGATFELGGFQVAGLGYSSPTPFATPGEYSEQGVRRTFGEIRRSQAAYSYLPLAALRY